MENNQLHKSGDSSILYNVAIKGFPLLPYIFICTSPVYFAVMKFSSATSMYLSVSASEHGTKSAISGVM